LKYRDKKNPLLSTFNNFKRKFFYDKRLKLYWIECDNKKVGELLLGFKDDYILVARIFILKKYQNKGIAQKALIIAENMFPKNKVWRLDTIKQENKNCYLYEKLGYKPTGNENIINKRMTIIDYEKNKR
jgi:hypothetical protein